MRFPWLPYIGYDHAPLLPVGVRRGGTTVGTDLVVMVDTGADQTLLHLSWAGLMGFQTGDLNEESCKSANGPMTVFRPKNNRKRIDFQVGGLWFAVPSIQFGRKVPVPLLGRDMIFKHFDLRMNATHFELHPKHLY